MLDWESLRGLHVAVATPCYGGQVAQNYLLSVIKLVYAAQRHGVLLSFIVRGGDSLIPRTRNSIVAEFMATEAYTHLLWIDADVGFEPEAVWRLLRADRDVVAGVYPRKWVDWPDRLPAGMTQAGFEALYARYPFNPLDGRMDIDADGFAEVLDAPAGFMLVRRSVLFRMRDAYPELRVALGELPGLDAVRDRVGEFGYRFFDLLTEPGGRYLSEDYAFCRRWQRTGGKVFVDCRSNLTHQGLQLYVGSFMASLQALDEDGTEEG